MNESFLGSKPTTIQHEKVLADFFETSVGHVDILESNLHLYNVKSLGETIKAIIFSESEINSIKENIQNKLIDRLYSKEIIVDSLGGVKLGFEIVLPMNEIVQKREIKIDKISDVQYFRIISKILESSFDTTNYSNQISFYRIKRQIC